MPVSRPMIAGALAALLAAAALAPPPPAAAQAEVPKEVVAVQIRKQGFECKNPQSATRDAEASKPDNEVWILACEGVTYRVGLIPNQAARVERLSDASDETEQPAAQPDEQRP